ncbi:MAG: restriction endonuclease subunit S [Pseudomonadota bacterium]
MSTTRLVKLGSLIEVQHGYAFESTGFQESGEFALLTPGNFHEEGGFRRQGAQQRRYEGVVDLKWILEPGAILIAMTEQAAGLLGSAIRIPEGEKWLHNQRMGLVEIKRPERVCADYLYHWFNSASARKSISVAASGTKVRHSSPSQIHSLQLSLPDLRTQLRVAETLDEWCTAIEKTISLLKALERRKQGLMQQLLTGRRLLKGFQGKWKSVRVGSFADAVRSINTTARALPVLSCTKYAGLVDSLKYFNKQVFSENSTTYKIVERGQFVYATNHIEEGSIGYQDLYDAALVSPMYTVFEPNAEVINHQFLYMLLKTEAMRRVFEATTHSSVDRRGSLRWPEFAKLKISIPPMPEQERIVAVLETASAAVDLARRQLDELKTQKRALMQKLLSGEWRLPEKPVPGKSLSKKGL